MAQTWWRSDPRHSWFCTSVRTSQRATSSWIFYQGCSGAFRTSGTKRPVGKSRSHWFDWLARLARSPWETGSVGTNRATGASGSSWPPRKERRNGVRGLARTGWTARTPGISHMEDYNRHIHALLQSANGKFKFSREISWFSATPINWTTSVYDHTVLRPPKANFSRILKAEEFCCNNMHQVNL